MPDARPVPVGPAAAAQDAPCVQGGVRSECYMDGCNEPAQTLPGTDLPTLYCATHRAAIVKESNRARRER